MNRFGRCHFIFQQFQRTPSGYLVDSDVKKFEIDIKTNK